MEGRDRCSKRAEFAMYQGGLKPHEDCHGLPEEDWLWEKRLQDWLGQGDDPAGSLWGTLEVGQRRLLVWKLQQ